MNKPKTETEASARKHLWTGTTRRIEEATGKMATQSKRRRRTEYKADQERTSENKEAK